MKIKLIAPHERRGESISSGETFKFQRVNLPLLAALTPPGHTVKLVDETFLPDDVDEDVDLVGITVMTDLALRAYQIGETYRERGIRVVMGGIHPTVLPFEALQYADAVVVGEAEEVWPRLVSDAASGHLQKLYRSGRLADLRGLPRPRQDLYPKPLDKGYTPIPVNIEASRGCPYDCEFCSIGHVMGHQYRLRPVEDIVDEMESSRSRYFLFADDALALNRVHAKKLFAMTACLGRLWAGQGTVSLAQDLELLRLMKRSGCLGLLIGFESVQKEIQAGMRKTRNLTIDFAEAMRRFHGEGLSILGAFVFGFDHETRDVFDQTFEFIERCHIDCVELRILTPFPGTRLHTRLLVEGRLFQTDWWLHGHPPDTLLFRPKGMTPDELLNGFARLNRETYSFGSMFKRFLGMNPWKRSSLGCRVYAGFNLATRKRYLEGLANPQPFLGSLGPMEASERLMHG